MIRDSKKHGSDELHNEPPEALDLDFEPDDVGALIEGVTIDVPDANEAMSLSDAMTDIAVAHYELSSYKRGAITLAGAMDEAILEAENGGNCDLVDLLREVKRSCVGIALRVKRGDDELLGKEDGKFSGYFAEEDPGESIEDIRP